MKHFNFYWQNFLKKYFYSFIKFYAHLRFSVNMPDILSPNNIQFNINYALRWFNYYNSKYPLICKQIDRLLNNHYKKKQRVKFRIEKFLNSSDIVYFGTLTFTDLVLNSTSFNTRRTYVRRFLKLNCSDYVANTDYGSLNEREHYHTCFISKNSNFFESWKYGFVNVKKIYSQNDFNALAEYLLKLANHTTKDSASCVIYSRGK